MINGTGLAAMVLSAAAISYGARSGADALVPLPAADRSAIDANLGPGLLGESLPAPVILDPGRYITLAPSVRTFRIVQGFNAGREEPFRLLPELPAAVRTRWRYLSGNEEAGFLEVQADGSLGLTGVQDRQSGALTRYDPAEPFLVKGIAPGQERRIRMAVRVLDADRPGQVTHRGLLTVVYRYVGAYRLALPAGTYDAVLMKSTFSGQVGPAQLEDTQYRFFAPKDGLVATIEHRHVSAFLLYQSDTKVARILVRNGE